MYLLLIAVGVTLGMVAGGVQRLAAEDGVFAADLIRLLIWSAPLAITAKAIAKISGTVSLYVVAGGAAVPVYAGMQLIYQLNQWAEKVSADLTLNKEEV